MNELSQSNLDSMLGVGAEPAPVQPAPASTTAGASLIPVALGAGLAYVVSGELKPSLGAGIGVAIGGIVANAFFPRGGAMSTVAGMAIGGFGGYELGKRYG